MTTLPPALSFSYSLRTTPVVLQATNSEMEGFGLYPGTPSRLMRVTPSGSICVTNGLFEIIFERLKIE